MPDEEDLLGPIDIIAVELPAGRVGGDGGARRVTGVLTDAEFEEQEARILRG